MYSRTELTNRLYQTLSLQQCSFTKVCNEVRQLDEELIEKKHIYGMSSRFKERVLDQTIEMFCREIKHDTEAILFTLKHEYVNPNKFDEEGKEYENKWTRLYHEVYKGTPYDGIMGDFDKSDIAAIKENFEKKMEIIPCEMYAGGKILVYSTIVRPYMQWEDDLILQKNDREELLIDGRANFRAPNRIPLIQVTQ